MSTYGGQQFFITVPIDQTPTSRVAVQTDGPPPNYLANDRPTHTPVDQLNNQKHHPADLSNNPILTSPAIMTFTPSNNFICPPNLVQSPVVDCPANQEAGQYPIIRLYSSSLLNQQTNLTATTTTLTTSTVRPNTVLKLTNSPKRLLIPISSYRFLEAADVGQVFQIHTVPASIQPMPNTLRQWRKISPKPAPNLNLRLVPRATPNQQVPRQALRPNAMSVLTVQSGGGPPLGQFVPIATNLSGGPVTTGCVDGPIQQGVQQKHQQAPPMAESTHKPCRCRRSRCLKRYCDCFSNGEFCSSSCRCTSCANNLTNEEIRQQAIKRRLTKNPYAFWPKVTQSRAERKHTKGCACRRSGCLKNYCECYMSRIACSEICKCCDCKNQTKSNEPSTLFSSTELFQLPTWLSGRPAVNKAMPIPLKDRLPSKLPASFEPPKSCSLITSDLVGATSDCLFAQAKESQKLGLSGQETERAIVEEFGSCLGQIIQAAQERKREAGQAIA